VPSDSLAEYLAKHSGFTENDIEKYKCFIFCEQRPFKDASDDKLTAMVRYVNPQNDKDWGYDVYVLHDTFEPSAYFGKLKWFIRHITNCLERKI